VRAPLGGTPSDRPNPLCVPHHTQRGWLPALLPTLLLLLLQVAALDGATPTEAAGRVRVACARGVIAPRQLFVCATQLNRAAPAAAGEPQGAAGDFQLGQQGSGMMMPGPPGHDAGWQQAQGMAGACGGALDAGCGP
jgi:hypothetical protein